MTLLLGWVGCLLEFIMDSYGRVCGVQWLCGRALSFQSKGPGFEITSAVSKLGKFRSYHFTCVFQKRQ